MGQQTIYIFANNIEKYKLYFVESRGLDYTILACGFPRKKLAWYNWMASPLMAAMSTWKDLKSSASTNTVIG